MGRGKSRNTRADRYRAQKERESRAAFGATQKTFAEYIEHGKGRLVNEVGNYIVYTESGTLIVEKEKVKQAAFEFVKESQEFPEYPKEYVLKSFVEGPGGRVLSPQYAEDKINTEYALKARGILIAAKFGKVPLTTAQKERLERTEKGEYLDLVYGQYGSGTRGTLLGKKKENRGGAGSAATPEAREEKRQEFFSTLYRYAHNQRKVAS